MHIDIRFDAKIIFEKNIQKILFPIICLGINQNNSNRLNDSKMHI